MDLIKLRDFLFASRFQKAPSESLFRYLAVEPGGVDDSVATVHFAYAPPVWDRAGYDSSPADVMALLTSLIAETPYKDQPIALECHRYLGTGWPIAWEITAKASFDNFPLLVLCEDESGKVDGLLMRDAHCCNVKERLASAYVEPEDVRDLFAELRAAPANVQFLPGLYSDYSFTADSIDAAIVATPETEGGQKHVLVYRNAEWLSGLWNNPAKPNAFPMQLSSVADFFGTRVSAAKLRTRAGLDMAKGKHTIPGDYGVLEQALRLLTPHDADNGVDYEAVPAVSALCDWWNANAPEGMRSAAFFRAYIWAPERATFIAGDPEEPALQAEILADMPAYAVFERHGRPTVALSFFRGRASYKEGEWGTQTFYVDGAEAYDIGMDLPEVDEAYYAVVGLLRLAQELDQPRSAYPQGECQCEAHEGESTCGETFQ